MTQSYCISNSKAKTKIEIDDDPDFWNTFESIREHFPELSAHIGEQGDRWYGRISLQ